jgi:hypothetical protein
MIELGDKVKDKITGFTGIAIGITVWQNGCRTIGIKTLKLKDGRPQDAFWMDENQVEIVLKRAKVIKPIVYKTDEKEVVKTGGPHELPGRMMQPK